MNTMDRAGSVPSGALTDDQLSDLQLAEDLIDTMYSIVWSRIWKRRAEHEPNAASLKELRKALSQCDDDRRLLRWHRKDRAAMKAIIDHYTVAVRDQLAMH
ncbi:hypothetical protein Xkhy_14480 [Xanthomonas axonopodis pv. khayae]|uniref:hypothetical protein n=1 Tax=Pseudomonadota TaxID=1224 RepID=UPI0005286C4A|nr:MULTISPECIES: hypothetical protein [Pseudomonadota]OOX23179.1 hypothetical protein Xazr_21020 [Xanthomonas campestris pv. azadirachtae]AZR29184.1 hypothetical protein NX80_023025 [Xanthomonas vasicola pv. arecae]MBE0317750.1 hypothetical protein [Xanthomonas citri pv. punicae]MBN4668215.1 hypothetical protein [Pandoraea nosoerga]MBN4678069.1 hypothetical protein [Pandoraea nosoerga]